MRQNKYDDNIFFEKYSQMDRSVKGLTGAGEWHILKNMLPDFKNKRILDLGCGFGWHCQYAYEHGASKIVGVDISERMLSAAKEKTSSSIRYICKPIEDIDFEDSSFDIVISSLAFHYLKSFEDISERAYHILDDGGSFVFSVEHPIFTAFGTQEWYVNKNGEILHWPVDNYFYEGERKANFLGEEVFKYHKTLTTYINGLLKNGFIIKELIEPQPEEILIKEIPEMKNELRRPMMLLISAVKQ